MSSGRDNAVGSMVEGIDGEFDGGDGASGTHVGRKRKDAVVPRGRAHGESGKAGRPEKGAHAEVGGGRILEEGKEDLGKNVA